MSAAEDTARAALARVAYPGFRRDVVSLGVVREVRFEAGVLRVELDPGPAEPARVAELERAVTDALAGLPEVRELRIVRAPRSGGASALPMAGARPSTARAGSRAADLLPGVRFTIAVASGKGGVGKSTVAVNLAVALARQGRRVGLLDADIYGPSVPLMTGVAERPMLSAERKLVPFERHGVRLMSLGVLVDADSAVIWRGPMVMKALEQLLRDVEWGELDVLVVDMPPGTGDAQLTMSQRVSLAGAVIVSTPQDVALADARKGVAMFRKVDVPLLGIVENMSYFVCPGCSRRAEIFGHGGAAAEAQRLGVPFLGEIPLEGQVREGGDRGRPIVELAPDSPAATALNDLARRVWDMLQGADGAAAPPDGLFERFRKLWPGSGTP